MQDLDGVFDKMIDTVYKETSQHLLHILHSKYKFMDHLKVNSCHCTLYCYFTAAATATTTTTTTKYLQSVFHCGLASGWAGSPEGL